MGNRLMVLTVLGVGALLAVSLPRLVKTAQRPAAATTTPDLSGVWSPPPGAGGAMASLYFTREEPLMLPWAEERYKANRKGQGDVRPDHGRADRDPTRPPYCMPIGFPRIYAGSQSLGGGAFEIVQNPGKVLILFQSNNIQRIYTDGRKHPKGPPLSFLGQSIGRYEGDTLIVETKDLHELTWIDGMGRPHTDALRVEQRIRRVAPDTLEIDFLFDDPKAYKKPWKGKRIYKLMSDKNTLKDVNLEAFVCEDVVREEYTQKVLGEKPRDDAWRQLRNEGVGY